MTHELEKIGLNKERLLHDESSDDRYQNIWSPISTCSKGSLRSQKSELLYIFISREIWKAGLCPILLWCRKIINHSLFWLCSLGDMSCCRHFSVKAVCFSAACKTWPRVEPNLDTIITGCFFSGLSFWKQSSSQLWSHRWRSRRRRLRLLRPDYRSLQTSTSSFAKSLRQSVQTKHLQPHTFTVSTFNTSGNTGHLENPKQAPSSVGRARANSWETRFESRLGRLPNVVLLSRSPCFLATYCLLSNKDKKAPPKKVFSLERKLCWIIPVQLKT